MNDRPPVRRLWCLNLDAEDELRHGKGYTPSRATLVAVASAQDAARVLLGPEDGLLGEVPARIDDEARLGMAWCPTPSALAMLSAAGARVLPAPGLATLRRVNASSFPYEVLGARLAGAQVVDSFEAAEAWLVARSPTEAVWIKRAFGAAGRGKLRTHGGSLEQHTRDFLTAAELRLGVVLEPHVDIALEVSLHARLSPNGDLAVGVPCVQQVDAGRFVGVRLAAAAELRSHELTTLETALTSLASAMQRVGYFGPLGVDAYRYLDRDGQLGWNPCGELNARYTMGFAVGMRGAGLSW